MKSSYGKVVEGDSVRISCDDFALDYFRNLSAPLIVDEGRFGVRKDGASCATIFSSNDYFRSACAA